ncbi:MAG TPA: hypothetical protein DCO79_03100 [Spirochaeta sp.]|nr:hypothetical protein [Spirochaeta sp.]
MDELKNSGKNHKTILILIIVVLIFNTISILGVFFILDRRIENLNRTLLQVISRQTAAPSGLSAEPMNIDTSGYQVLGSASAPMEMALITDLECPYCQKLYSILFPQLNEQYISRGLLKLEYAPFPLESRHPKAMPAATVLHCADQQGQLWPMFHYLSAGINELDEESILNPKTNFIINRESFSECVGSEDTAAYIRSLKTKFSEAGVKGTPALVVDGKKLSGFSGLDDIAAYIDKQLRSAGKQISLKDVSEAVETGIAGILDVRTAGEFSAGHLPGAVNIDYFNTEGFSAAVAGLPADRDWIVYCKSGTRSTRAWHVLKEAGLGSLFNMADGFDGWQSAGYNISTE